MAVNVRGGDLDQLLLMPPSVREWLPEKHLAFFVLDVVAELDLAAFFAAYRGDGRGGSVYDPSMMLAVLVYAYCTGERSSRRIERRLVEDVAYRVLSANQQPDHATLARFRRRHQEGIAALFGQVLALCVRAGLVDAGLIAIDGTKIAADVSFFANRTREQLAKTVLAEAEQTDAAEDELFGDRGGSELPPQWSGGRGRRDRIRAALDELERQTARDYETRMAERAQKEAERGRKADRAGAVAAGCSPRRAAPGQHHRPALADHRHRLAWGVAGLQRPSCRNIRADRRGGRGHGDNERPAALRADDRCGVGEPRRRRP